MDIQIITPEKTFFDGKAYGIQVPGLKGSFEMLDNHAPMVAAIGEGTLKLLIDKNNTETLTFAISGGVVEMNNNKAIILAESIK